MMTVEEANAKYPIGTKVRFWPGATTERSLVGVIRSNAWIVGSTTCMLVSGYVGGISADHIQKEEMSIIRAHKRLEPCNDPDCRFAKSGSCKFGMRNFGCYMDSKSVKDAVEIIENQWGEQP